MGVDLRTLPVQVGIFGAEPWSNAMREEIDARLGISAVDLYGLSEIIGPGVAIECGSQRNGLHGWEDHFLFEVIDPKTLEPVAPGDPGELVITTLTKQALPMLRYRSRDITRCSDPYAHVPLRPAPMSASCASPAATTTLMIIRGVNIYPSQIEAVLVSVPGVAPHYQIVLTREGALDCMAIEVEHAPGVPAEHLQRHWTAKEVALAIKARLGVSCDVVIKAIGDVPRSQGKAVRVKDE